MVALESVSGPDDLKQVPAAVSTLFTFWQDRCISGALRQIRPNFFGLITSRTHSAPALDSLIIDMWDGSDQGFVHSTNP